MEPTAASGTLILPRLPAPGTRSAWRLRPGDIIATAHGPARVITRYAPFGAGRVMVIAETPTTPAGPGSWLALKHGMNEQVRVLPPAGHQTLLEQAHRIRFATLHAGALAELCAALDDGTAGWADWCPTLNGDGKQDAAREGAAAELEQARAELARLWQAHALGVAA